MCMCESTYNGCLENYKTVARTSLLKNHNVKDQILAAKARKISTPRIGLGQKKHRGSCFSNLKKLASGANERGYRPKKCLCKPFFQRFFKNLEKIQNPPEIPLGGDIIYTFLWQISRGVPLYLDEWC